MEFSKQTEFQHSSCVLSKRAQEYGYALDITYITSITAIGSRFASMRNIRCISILLRTLGVECIAHTKNAQI